MRRTIQQVACEEGHKARGSKRLRDSNPYDRKNSPSLSAAWDDGWRRKDRELRA